MRKSNHKLIIQQMKDDRTLFDLDDKEYEEMSDEEKCEISQNTNEMMMDIMFPDGQDEE